MKAELQKEDLSAIASFVIGKLTPLLGKQEAEDQIFTPETLSQYLSVDLTWVYRQASDKTIPYFKNGKYVRFRKSSIDKWISSHERQPIPKFKQIRHSKVTS